MNRPHPALNNRDAEQEIRTPPSIIRRVEAAFRGPIALDPCAPSFSGPTFFAERYVRDPRFEPGAEWTHAAEGAFRVRAARLPERSLEPDGSTLERGAAVEGRWVDDATPDLVEPASMLDTKGSWRFVSSPAPSGLDVEWPDRTFVNEPFGDLEEWLGKFVREFDRDPLARRVMLVPWRSHRAWFVDAIERTGAAVTFEPSVRFAGYKAGFPMPIALISTACRVEPAPHGLAR